MNIRLVSDLHNEFSDHDFDLPILVGEQDMVLVLAGDITAEMRDDVYAPFHWSQHTNLIREWTKRHRAVVMVAGNHEYYGGIMEDVREWWSNVDASEPDFHFLDNKTVIIDGVRFVGGTLWTNMKNANPMTMMTVQGAMNDFNKIKMRDGEGVKSFTAQDWLNEHALTLDYLKTRLAEEFDGPTVVVTHHLPSFQSVDPQFYGSGLNDGYASELWPFIYDNDVAMWFHGHTHASVDYMIGCTQVVCNPRGYAPDMLNPNFDPGLVLKL